MTTRGLQEMLLCQQLVLLVQERAATRDIFSERFVEFSF